MGQKFLFRPYFLVEVRHQLERLMLSKLKTKQTKVALKGFWNLVYSWNHERKHIVNQNPKFRIFTSFSKLLNRNKKRGKKQTMVEKNRISEFGIFVKPWGEHIIYQNSRFRIPNFHEFLIGLSKQKWNNQTRLVEENSDFGL